MRASTVLLSPDIGKLLLSNPIRELMSCITGTGDQLEYDFIVFSQFRPTEDQGGIRWN